ncbi:MAG: hypothetical protein ACI4D0_06575 [Lachnospira sp.]
MIKEQRKDINEMTKAELRFELDNMRIEYDRMVLRNDIMKLVDRMVLSMDLQKVKDFVEDVYKQEMEHWGFLYGMRDNIHDMADNLADMQNVDELQYFNHAMYYCLLDREPEATEGIYTTTGSMRKAVIEHLAKREGA